jgi:2-oxoglutarate-Fe(II)-dependent oxygenase superfamily protein
MDLEILNSGPWQDIFRRIHPLVTACMAHYLSRSPILQSFPLEGTGYKIQMYPQQVGFFRWHADSVGRNAGSRVVAMILYLNDVERGGETEFYHQAVRIAPRTGHLMLFPACWNYMHCGREPESSSKYIIQTFIRLKDTP